MFSDSDENSEALWEIRENIEIGRHLLATCDILAGQIIIKEDPLVIFPSSIIKVQNLFCLGCYKEIYNGDEKGYSKGIVQFITLKISNTHFACYSNEL